MSNGEQNTTPANYSSEGGTAYNSNPGGNVPIGVSIPYKGLTAAKVAAMVAKEVG
jgi:hypothetical protein